MFHDPVFPASSPSALLESEAFAREFNKIDGWSALSPAAKGFRHTRKESERFILWVLSSGLTLDTVEVAHTIDYRCFLADPQPQSLWVVTPPQPRFLAECRNPNWRPFAGPLRSSSVKQACSILHGLFEYLVLQSVIPMNPWREKARRGKARGSADGAEPVRNLLALETAFNFYRRTCSDLNDELPLRAARDYWALAVIYLTGANVGELVAARMSDFYRDETGWWLRLRSPAASVSSIALGPDFLELLQFYRQSMGRPSLPSPDEADLPLVGDAHSGRRPLTSSAFYKVIRNALSRAAHQLTEEDAAANVLRSASPLWLRRCSRARLREIREKATTSDVCRGLSDGSQPRMEMAIAWEFRLPGLAGPSLRRGG